MVRHDPSIGVSEMTAEIVNCVVLTNNFDDLLGRSDVSERRKTSGEVFPRNS